jgi:hypothetical protein
VAGAGLGARPRAACDDTMRCRTGRRGQHY